MAKFVEKFDLWKKQRADKRKQMEQDRRIQDFLSLAKAGGNVSAFLEKISLSEDEDRIENYERLIPYEDALMSTYNRDRIVELLTRDSCDDFFKSGWFYQTVHQRAYESHETGKPIKGFEYRSCLPKEFWLDEELVKLFLNQAEKFRYGKASNIYKIYDPFDRSAPIPDWISFNDYDDYQKNGFKTIIRRCQLSALGTLERFVIAFEIEKASNTLSSEEINAYTKKEEAVNKKIKLLKTNNLFLMDKESSERVYDKYHKWWEEVVQYHKSIGREVLEMDK